MATTIHIPQGRFSIGETRSVIKDLFDPNPTIYWADFLASILVGHASAVLLILAPVLFRGPGASAIAAQVGFFAVACLAYYRSVLFIHELVHLPPGKFRTFRFAWNVLCGVPLLVPSFVYYTHRDHHRRKHYGTEHDGEYVPFGHRGPVHILFYLSQSFVIPFLGVVRFGLLPPLCWLFPPLRRWVHQHASSMVIDPTYIRPLPQPQTLRIMQAQEACCFLWCLAAGLALWFLPLNWSLYILALFYALAFAIVSVNAVRTLGAHRWQGAGGEMSFEEQLLDTVNYPKGLAAELWAPVGTRYHALHHLFPSLPYHAMPEAHRRLMARLPADSPYKQTEARSLLGVLSDLWRRSAVSRP